MRWPSKNPDDYFDPAVAAPKEGGDPAERLPARYRVAIVTVGLVGALAAAAVSRPIGALVALAICLLELCVEAWWFHRMRAWLLLGIAAGGVALGYSVWRVTGIALAGWLAAIVPTALLLRTLRSTRDAVAPRPDPAPLRPPAWLARLGAAITPSKDPADYGGRRQDP